MHYVDDDLVTLPDFFASLGWSDEKIHVFLNPSEMPKLFLTPKIMDRWDSLLWFLNSLVRCSFVSSVETIAQALRPKDEDNLVMIDALLDRYFNIASARVRPTSKMSTESVRQIYMLALNGTATSRIAAQFSVSRKTVDLIKTKRIHQNLLP